MVPHEVVEHALRHAARAQGAAVHLLVRPLDPAGLVRRAVDQGQGVHL